MYRTRLLALLLLSLILSFALPVFAQDALPLTQHFVSEDESVAFSYPADWVIDLSTSGGDFAVNVSVATTDNALKKDVVARLSDTLKSGEVRINLIVAQKEALLQAIQLKSAESISDVVGGVVHAANRGTATWTDVTETTVSGHPAARVSFNALDRGEGFVLLADYEGGIIGGAAVFNAADESDQWEATNLAILDSLTVSVPAVEATPEATDAVPTEQAPDLTITYTSLNKAATFSYPNGWIVEEQPDQSAYLDAAISSSTAAADKTLGSGDDTFESGEVKVQLLVIDQNTFMSDPKIDANSTPIDILKAMQAQDSLPDGMTMSVITATSVHDLPGAQFRFEIGQQGEGRIALIRIRPGLMMLMAIFTAPGELEQWDATAQAIFESLTLADDVDSTPAETPEPLGIGAAPEQTPAPTIDLPQSATSKNGKNTMSYPAEWVTRNSGNAAIYVANSSKALNHQIGGTFAAGEVQILISVDSIANLTPGINLGLKPDATTAQVLASLMKATSSFLTFDEPEEMTINGMTASTVVLHGKHYEGRSIIIDFGDKLKGLVQVLAAPDELVNWTDTINAIVESVVHSE